MAVFDCKVTKSTCIHIKPEIIQKSIFLILRLYISLFLRAGNDFWLCAGDHVGS